MPIGAHSAIASVVGGPVGGGFDVDGAGGTVTGDAVVGGLVGTSLVGTVGGLVVLGGPIQLASDTESRIVRRRGGSAANVAATAAANGWPVRFLGQVGNDTIGTALVDELSAGGVDTRFVVHDGSTGTIIVLVDEAHRDPHLA